MTRINGHEHEQPTRGRPRRQLLTAAMAGGLGIVAGETIGGTATAQANDGNPVLQGTDNGTPTKRTAVITANEMGVLADPNTSGKGSLGVYGVGQTAGVWGEATGSGVGVEGVGGTGVIGVGTSGGFGVQGISGGGFSPGVSGQGNGNGAGVIGGGSLSGSNGVEGTARTQAGVGVVAENTHGGNGLQVTGKAAFDRSGILTINKGSSSATVTGIALTSSSIVLATLQGSLRGVHLQGVTKILGSPGSFKVHLNQAATMNIKVGWLVIN